MFDSQSVYQQWMKQWPFQSSLTLLALQLSLLRASKSMVQGRMTLSLPRMLLTSFAKSA